MKNFFTLTLAALLFISLQSCSKIYSEYDNLEVIEDTFVGDISADEQNDNVDVAFTTTGTSGSYCFIWTNTEKNVLCNLNLTGTGAVEIEIDDARGNIVHKETLSTENGSEFQFLSDKGPKGNWFIKMFFEDYSGEGEMTASPE